MKQEIKKWLIRQLNKIGLYTREQYNNSIETTFTAALHGWGKKEWIACLKSIENVDFNA